jgi:hypothetical protein
MTRINPCLSARSAKRPERGVLRIKASPSLIAECVSKNGAATRRNSARE